MSKIQKVRKAVIPAAGLGTRFLPQTKAMPKEMLPIVDKPIIQHIVEELVEVGIETIIIITGYHKRAIEDHFDTPSTELINNLKTGGKKKIPLLKETRKISELANFVYLRQKGPYGNGTPLLNVRSIIEGEPFIYAWGDDFIDANPSEFRQIVDVYEKYGCSVLSSVRAKKDDDYNRWGFVSGEEIEPGIIDAKKIIEKPGKEKAPSSLGNVSSFLFAPEIYNYIDEAFANLKEGKEFYYNDILKLMLKRGERVLAAEIKGGEFQDTGNKLEYMKTVVKFGLRHPEFGKSFRKYLKENI
ncbi:MAG: Nucleotidyl transferase [Candidatus Woesebacteria bacterium GW2011_GWB1_43_14]|uniref:UTP--glucose-1-phosphate uridylyltransferase n=1 Tax=Candidatus Woesebacteria bacterium GW2011_GWB1_43_14 TaxID=1618578 RepID=A0A0G1FVA9_9BACT|nr:MAG: UDP-glucose pyrophosphorylase [Candidatus Woesebacteria bacterium GW2011_GWC1_42_9]KKS98931.1 MAG: Nucleotidyl transferase [Candidatus Woesebacteria bacterium GW2011_GWB1_43_14]